MHEEATINYFLIYNQFLPHTKGVWIRENHGEDEKFDLI